MHIKCLHVIVDRDSELYKFSVQTCFKKNICLYYAYTLASHIVERDSQFSQFPVLTCICIFYAYKVALRNCRQGL